MCTSFIHKNTSSIHVCGIIHLCVHIIHLYVHHTFTCVNLSFTCVTLYLYVHIIHSYARHGFSETDTFLLIRMCVRMCACVSRCVRVWVQHQSETMTCVYCVCMFVCARVYIFVCVCLCLFVWCRRPTTRASHEFALADVESSQKIMSEKWARFPPPIWSILEKRTIF